MSYFGLVNDIGSTLIDVGPVLVVIIILVAVVLWSLAYLSRYFYYLKTKEFVYIDNKTLDFVRGVVQAIIIAVTIIVVLFLASLKSPEIANGFDVLMRHMPSIIFIVITVCIALIIVMFIHRFGEYLRGNLRTKPQKIAPPGTLEYAETALKYTIYIVAAMVAVIGGLALLPPDESIGLEEVFLNLQESLQPTMTIPLVTSLVLLGIITVIIGKVMDTFYEDLHKHSKKHSARVNEILKSISKNILYVVALLIGFFLILSKFLSYTELILTLGIIMLIVVLVIFLLSDLIRNSLSGLSLMVSDPFSEGDRVKILDGLVCDIMQTHMTYTMVKTLKGEVVTIPNTELAKHNIVNLTRSERFAISVKVGVDAGLPPGKVEALLKQACEKTSMVMNEPLPEIFSEGFREKSTIYELLAYTNSPKEVKRTTSELVHNIQELFRAEGLSVNMPHE